MEEDRLSGDLNPITGCRGLIVRTVPAINVESLREVLVPIDSGFLLRQASGNALADGFKLECMPVFHIFHHSHPVKHIGGTMMIRLSPVENVLAKT
jgi:hypothetical protein